VIIFQKHCSPINAGMMLFKFRIMNLNLEGNKLGDINSEFIIKALFKN
jgi:hypothetical protein